MRCVFDANWTVCYWTMCADMSACSRSPPRLLVVWMNTQQQPGLNLSQAAIQSLIPDKSARSDWLVSCCLIHQCFFSLKQVWKNNTLWACSTFAHSLWWRKNGRAGDSVSNGLTIHYQPQLWFVMLFVAAQDTTMYMLLLISQDAVQLLAFMADLLKKCLTYLDLLFIFSQQHQ